MTDTDFYEFALYLMHGRHCSAICGMVIGYDRWLVAELFHFGGMGEEYPSILLRHIRFHINMKK